MLEWERWRGGGYLWWMGSRADGVGDGCSRARMENGCVWIGSRSGKMGEYFSEMQEVGVGGQSMEEWNKWYIMVDVLEGVG